MFKLAMSPTFWSEVKADVVDEKGRRVPIAFDLQFKRLTPREIAEMAPNGIMRNDTDVLPEIVVDWKRVADDDGNELPFSADNLLKLIDLGLAGAIAATFLAAQPKARAKN